MFFSEDSLTSFKLATMETFRFSKIALVAEK